ncbi:MAG TPA: tetratricopeptide repeat protein [Candidatus Sulfopaludibacter sp.]|nr:tetratricopeptide repeat protein [Candidatus Sulfopaludibacter sp.]
MSAILLFVSLAAAADDQQLALLLKAQTDFDRVDLSASPQLPQTSACVLSQAALVPIAPPADLPIVYFRKAWCTLAGATITGNPSLYQGAIADFQKAIDSWPGRVAVQPKKTTPEPISPAFPVMDAIAKLLASPGNPAVEAAARQQLVAAVATPTCLAEVMPALACQADVKLGREWLGYIALSAGQLADAARYFAGSPDSGWPAWVAGRQAFQSGNYAEAVRQYRSAIGVWQAAGNTGIRQRFGQPRDLGLALTDLGGAQLLSGDTVGAIATLDQAVKTDPAHARTFFYRARAKEIAGRGEAALADYSIAARTAFAATADLSSGEAHLYRGITAYRRKDFPRAEDEFSSALNFSIPPEQRADAVAWRHLSAVAAGNCDASRNLLTHDLSSVSPFFPKNEASTLIAGCPTASAAK